MADCSAGTMLKSGYRCLPSSSARNMPDVGIGELPPAYSSRDSWSVGIGLAAGKDRRKVLVAWQHHADCDHEPVDIVAPARPANLIGRDRDRSSSLEPPGSPMRAGLRKRAGTRHRRVAGRWPGRERNGGAGLLRPSPPRLLRRDPGRARARFTACPAGSTQTFGPQIASSRCTPRRYPRRLRRALRRRLRPPRPARRASTSAGKSKFAESSGSASTCLAVPLARRPPAASTCSSENG